MIEVTILNYLNTKLDPIAVFMEVPEGAPDKYVLIEKTGSRVNNHIRSATFAIQSIAPSLYEAAELNEMVKEAMDAIIELNEIARSSLNSDYNFTNTAAKQYRYQAVYDLVHY